MTSIGCIYREDLGAGILSGSSSSSVFNKSSSLAGGS